MDTMWSSTDRSVSSRAGRDRAAVDRVSDGPQRGGEGDAFAWSRARRRPEREFEWKLHNVGIQGGEYLLWSFKV